MRTFYFSLSSSHQYSRQPSRDKIAPSRVTIQLRPAAQAALCLLRPIIGGDEYVYYVGEEPPLWQWEFQGQSWLDLQYKGRALVCLRYKGKKIGLHVKNTCEVNGCKEHWKDEWYPNTSNILSKSSLGKDACEQDQNPTYIEGFPTVSGDPLWDECTYINWGGCQSRQLDDGNFLWLSTRTLDDPDGTRTSILDLDISAIDRRGVFF